MRGGNIVGAVRESAKVLDKQAKEDKKNAKDAAKGAASKVKTAAPKLPAPPKVEVRKPGKPGKFEAAPLPGLPQFQLNPTLTKLLIAGLEKVKNGGGKVELPFVACAGGPVHGLMVGNASSQVKSQLSKATGGRQFIEGTCVAQDGKITFVVPAMKPGLGKSLATAIQHWTGKKYAAAAREAGPAAAAGSSADLAQWAKVKSALLPDIKKALSGDAGIRPQVAALVAESTKHEKAGRPADAIGAFERLEKFLRKSTSGGGPAGDVGGRAKAMLGQWKAAQPGVAQKLAQGGKEALAAAPPDGRARIVDALRMLDASRRKTEAHVSASLASMSKARDGADLAERIAALTKEVAERQDEDVAALSQLAFARVQEGLNRVYQMLSNMMKAMHEMQMTPIRALRG